VAIPHINVNESAAVYSAAPRADSTYVLSEFRGGASAVRRDLFLRLGGFNPALWRQTEEYDFCTRLLAHGYLTRCGTATPILHYESPNRSLDSIFYHSARGRLIYAWRNVPWPVFPVHAAATAAMCLRDGFRRRSVKCSASACVKCSASGLASAVSAIFSSNASRCPVSLRAYLLMRRLRRRGPMKLSSATTWLSTSP
jgi:GT2 family glycosyltransferase